MDKLAFINKQMDILAIPYEFMEWTDDNIPNPYFTGECPSGEEILDEDGSEETTFILNGFYRGKERIELERIKEKVKKHFDPIFGLRAKTSSGSIAVFYENAFYVPIGESDLKRIQITLNIREWKGVK